MRGSAIRKSGVVHGMEREENCNLLLRLQSGSKDSYCEGLVINAPATLPDGEYVVQFERHTMHARKVRGQWIYSNVFEPDGLALCPEAAVS